MSSPRRSNVRWLLTIVILVTCIGCDQATKMIATRTLKDAPPRLFLADTVRLEYALNSGGFLSLGSGLPADVRAWIFIGLNSIMMLGLSAYLFLNRHKSIAVFVAVAFILAGGIGNQIDRISNHGLVTDFINLGIGPLRTGVFNVADMAVTFGGIAIALMMLRNQPPEPTGAIASEALSASHGKPILQDQ